MNCETLGRSLSDLFLFRLGRRLVLRDSLAMAVSDEKLKRARDVAAEIVATYDVKYAPYLDILNTEIKRREARADLIAQTLSAHDITELRARRRKRRKNLPGKGARS